MSMPAMASAPAGTRVLGSKSFQYFTNLARMNRINADSNALPQVVLRKYQRGNALFRCTHVIVPGY